MPSAPTSPPRLLAAVVACVALVAAVSGLAACSDPARPSLAPPASTTSDGTAGTTDGDGSTAGSDGVRVLSIGTAPRTVAVRSLRAGLTDRFTLSGSGHTQELEVTTYQPAGDYPQGPRLSLEIRVRAATADGIDPAQLRPLTDLGGTADLTTAGALTDLSFTAPSGLPAAARRELRIIRARLLALGIPVPSTPIGLGARWRRSDDPSRTYRLISRDADRLTVTVTGSATGSDPGPATATVRFGRPLATRSGAGFSATRTAPA